MLAKSITRVACLCNQKESIVVKRNMLAIIVIVVIVAAAILLTPVALAGAVTVPVSQIAFSENTGSGSVK